MDLWFAKLDPVMLYPPLPVLLTTLAPLLSPLAVLPVLLMSPQLGVTIVVVQSRMAVVELSPAPVALVPLVTPPSLAKANVYQLVFPVLVLPMSVAPVSMTDVVVICIAERARDKLTGSKARFGTPISAR